jgi:diguanylate cyclase (GGDEF)-like protein/PAS domain S-box-containing protein
MPDINHSIGISKPTSIIKPLLSGLVLINLTIVLFASFALYKSREQSEQLAITNTQNLAQVLEYSVAGLVDKIDIVLQISAYEIEHQIRLGRIDPLTINQHLKLQQQRVPDLYNLRVTDEAGDLRYGSDFSVLPQVNYADRDYYLQLRDNPNAGLFIAKPLLGKTTHKWLLTFSRRLNNPDASFAGVVYGTIELDHFSQLFSAIEVGPEGSIALRSIDLGLIARYPKLQLPSDGIGNQKLSVPFDQALRTSPDKGTYHSDATSIDGIIRAHSYIKFKKYPFYINVGLAEEDYLTAWRKEAWIVAGLVFAFLFSSSVFSLLMMRSLRRQQSDSEKLHGLFELSPLGIALTDLRGRYIEFNQAFLRICGYSAHELRDLDYWTLTPQKYESQETAQLESITHTGYYGPYEKEYRRKDGSLIPLRLNGMLIAGSDNQRYIWSIVEDISAQKRTEEEMKLASLVYRTSSEAMMVTDADNKIISINPAFTVLTGYSLEDSIGKNPKLLDSGQHDQAFYEALWESVKTTGNWQGEVWNCRKSGDAYVEWLSINTIYNDDGSVYRRVAMFSDITEKKKNDELIWRQANYDVLTDLPNRRMVHDHLKAEIKKAQRNQKLLALLFIDLDRFKEVNDTLGHEIGDALLIEAARRMSGSVRETDTVGRLGGDEFMIILTELDDIGSISRIANKLLDTLAKPYRLGKEVAYISASIGITIYPNDATDFTALLKNADQAMYAAKHQGRNCFHYYTAAMQEAANTRVKLSNDLHTALADNQFRVYYQPIVELATGAIRKAEALIRWQHPTLGLISPADFIPIAEDTGQIIAIGDWVFRRAAAQSVHLRASHHPEFQISVNMSPVQFRSNLDNHSPWFAHLKELGLTGQSIVIEITEGLLMEVREKISHQLLKFRDNGTQVALDDFGTGYSSLAYLKKFDIDYLKIDQSFVRNLAPESNDMALCEAMIVMAHKLGIDVIAEGVETQEQRDLLKQIGCNFGQGYLFSKPIPAEELEKLLKNTE